MQGAWGEFACICLYSRCKQSARRRPGLLLPELLLSPPSSPIGRSYCRLCEYVQHLSIIDYVCISTKKERRVLEYVDHLHECL